MRTWKAKWTWEWRNNLQSREMTVESEENEKSLWRDSDFHSGDTLNLFRMEELKPAEIYKSNKNLILERVWNW